MRTIHLLLILLLTASPSPVYPGVRRGPAAAAPIQQPVLFWSGGGCSGGYCQTGWYSSPVVANVDGDTQAEVIGSAYTVYILDGLTGSIQAEAKSGHDVTQPGAGDVGRTWADVAYANIDGTGLPEIITAHSDGWVSAYTQDLHFFPGWPKQPTPGSELRSLATSDLDQNGDLEILVAATRSQNQWYAFEHTGNLRGDHWPQHSPDSDTNGYTAGCYNQNIAAGDLDGDGRQEIIGPNDTHYLAAFQDDGSQVLASAIYGKINGSQKVWSRVGVHVDHSVDLVGYANCGTDYRPNFAHSAPIIVDVDGNGALESVVVGNVYNCGTNPYTDLYEIPFILNGDRTRWSNDAFDWTVLPLPRPGSAPLSEDWEVIENAHPNPAAADLDNDGRMEIIYPSYDGRVHAIWLDKTEHGSWPYAVKKIADSTLRFASEAAVADLNGDGQAEVIFTSWPQKGTNQTGKLHILSSNGVPIWEVSLPAAMGGASWNGGLAAPTLANIDLNPDLEVVINTAHSGLAAYHLPGTAAARILWGTGRGSYLRSGALQHGYLAGPTMHVNRPASRPGETLTYTIVLRSLGTGVEQATLTNPLPSGLTFAGGLTPATAGYSGGLITWSGSVPAGQPVTITYQAQVDPGITGPQGILSTAQASDGSGAALVLSTMTIVNAFPLFQPAIRRQ